MEQYAKIQQILKKEEGQKERKPIYPPTVIQAVFDAKTGASLEAILAQFNSIYVQYQGTPKETRCIIPEEMRRAGLTITYMNMDSETITERAASAVQKDNDHWGLDINWSRVDELSLSGDISVSAQGTWIINGEDTGIKALGPKGDAGLTPWLKTIDNRLHFSYDNVNWEPCSEPIAAYFRFNATSGNTQSGTIGKIQISRDNKTWSDLSPEFTNNLHIAGYVATTSALPANKPVGTIYGVGPTYATEDTAQTNPIYRLYAYNGTTWVDNGQFTSIAAGIVQETGDSETEVMSQKATTEKLTELAREIETFNITTISGGYYTSSGTFITNTGFSYTDFIKVVKGDVIKYRGYAGNTTVSAISAYNENKTFMYSLLIGEPDIQKSEDIIIPEGVAYIKISIANETHSSFVMNKVSLIMNIKNACRKEDIESLSKDIESLSKDIEDLSFIKEQIPLIHNGYISSSNGYIHPETTTFSSSDLIPVKEGDIVKYRGYAGNPAHVAAVSGYNERMNEGFVRVLLEANGGVVDAKLTIPEGISYIRVTAANKTHADYVESSIFFLIPILKYVEKKLQESSVLKGKKIAVIGDSISTINGNNMPYWEVKTIDVGKEIQSYVTWGDVYHNASSEYPTNKKIGGILLTEDMVGTLQTFVPSSDDVGKQIGVPLNYNAATTKIWSEFLCEITGATLLANASWSGSRITTHGDSKVYAISEAWSDYTIHRCQRRNDDGSYETPDVIIIYRGTNDFSHTPYASINDVDLSNGLDAETDFIDGNYLFRIGYYKTIQKLRNKYPKAIIYCATLNVFKRIIYDKFPTRNGIYTLPQMNDIIRDIADTMGCGLIEFDKDGITFENCYTEGYITDSETIPTHPNSKGHEVMARKAILDITHTL